MNFARQSRVKRQTARHVARPFHQRQCCVARFIRPCFRCMHVLMPRLCPHRPPGHRPAAELRRVEGRVVLPSGFHHRRHGPARAPGPQGDLQPRWTCETQTKNSEPLRWYIRFSAGTDNTCPAATLLQPLQICADYVVASWFVSPGGSQPRAF